MNKKASKQDIKFIKDEVRERAGVRISDKQAELIHEDIMNRMECDEASSDEYYDYLKELAN